MSVAFYERPILNSPYEYPSRHWRLDRGTGGTVASASLRPQWVWKGPVRSAVALICCRNTGSKGLFQMLGRSDGAMGRDGLPGRTLQAPASNLRPPPGKRAEDGSPRL